MKSSASLTTLALIAGISLSAIGATQASNIVISGGSADWNFFYDSGNDSFDVVLRNKGTTVATGLDTPYAGAPGGVGDGDDFTFSTLTVGPIGGTTTVVNGNTYIISSALQGIDAPGNPDFGIRTRFRELDGGGNTVNQFNSFRMTLDWANSTFPAGAEMILFRPDVDDDLIPFNDILFETADNDLIHDWPAWGHTHWNWGFTEEGTYDLQFDIQGYNIFEDEDTGIITETAITGVGTTNVSFVVIPEPSTAGLALLAAGLAFAVRRRPLA